MELCQINLISTADYLAKASNSRYLLKMSSHAEWFIEHTGLLLTHDQPEFSFLNWQSNNKRKASNTGELQCSVLPAGVAALCRLSLFFPCLILLSAFCWEVNAGTDPFLAVTISYSSLIYYKERSSRFRTGKETSEKKLRQ